MLESRGVVEGGSGGSLLKIMRDFGGLLSLLRTSLRLVKFIIANFAREKKGEVRFYQNKKNATALYSLSPSFNHGPHTSNNTASLVTVLGLHPCLSLKFHVLVVICNLFSAFRNYLCFSIVAHY